MKNTVSSNIKMVEEIVGNIVASHFFLLPLEVQLDYTNKLEVVFTGLARVIADGDHDPQLLKLSQEIQSIFVLRPFNEYLFAQKLKIFIAAAHLQDELVSFTDGLDQLIAHARPFYFSEEIAKKENARLPVNKIIEHDKKILRDSGQLYALDYFLYLDKLLPSSKPADAKDIILRGNSKLPALRDDALSEDMLIKIVYGLWYGKFRYQMIRDFYEYKKTFVGLGDIIDDADILLIVRALQKYCLKLLKTYYELGIDEISHGVYFPYPKGTKISSIIDNLKSYGEGRKI